MMAANAGRRRLGLRWKRQVFWLPDHPRAAPSHRPDERQWLSSSLCPRLQRRDRDGIAPSSLLSLAAPFPVCRLIPTPELIPRQVYSGPPPAPANHPGPGFAPTGRPAARTALRGRRRSFRPAPGPRRPGPGKQGPAQIVVVQHPVQIGAHHPAVGAHLTLFLVRIGRPSTWVKRKAGRPWPWAWVRPMWIS